MSKFVQIMNTTTNNDCLQVTNHTSNPNQFRCNLCQRQFRSSSALYQHGKRLSHLKRAMKISSSRCTTITNGKITSSIQRCKPLSLPLPIIPISSPSQPSSSLLQTDLTSNEQIVIHRNQHKEKNTTSYTCTLCGCRCWSIRNMRRHVRLHADVRPYICNICQMKFKSYSNLMKHLKTSRHQQNKDNNKKNWTIDTQALDEQNGDNQNETDKIPNESLSSSIDESNNLLEDLQIPDSRLIDGDAAELALIDPNTFEELHKAAECLLNLQGVFYFGEDENGTERSTSLLST
ncbi:hypothetical protein I4U23_020562 [Adineta vaga]|nr:hypothetical protein I4U23_020562 [Adineta vaga]